MIWTLAWTRPWWGLGRGSERWRWGRRRGRWRRRGSERRRRGNGRRFERRRRWNWRRGRFERRRRGDGRGRRGRNLRFFAGFFRCLPLFFSSGRFTFRFFFCSFCLLVIFSLFCLLPLILCLLLSRCLSVFFVLLLVFPPRSHVSSPSPSRPISFFCFPPFPSATTANYDKNQNQGSPTTSPNKQPLSVQTQDETQDPPRLARRGVSGRLWACNAVSMVTIMAGTAEGAGAVGTICMGVAVVEADLTFVDIWKWTRKFIWLTITRAKYQQNWQRWRRCC